MTDARPPAEDTSWSDQSWADPSSTEPWDTPERAAQAQAHEVAMQQQRRRQTLSFLVAVVVVAVIGLIALVLAQGWFGIGGSTATPTPCPTQTVAKPADTTIRVMNSTSRKGLAAKTAAAFKGRGYQVAGVGNVAAGTAGKAPILFFYGTQSIEEARAVAAQVVGAKLKDDGRSGTTVTVVIGDQFKGLRPAKEAAPLLAQKPMPKGCVTTTP